MTGTPLTVDTLARTIRRSPRLVCASPTIGIDLSPNAVSACRTDGAGIAACATCIIGACDGCVADLICAGHAAVGEIACRLSCCHICLRSWGEPRERRMEMFSLTEDEAMVVL